MKGLEVITENLSSNPRCGHGPTVLFKRGPVEYFACSAYRNKKDCNFHLTVDERRAGKTRKFHSIRIDHEQAHASFQKAQSAGKGQSYCHTCSIPFLTQDKDHSGHRVTADVSAQTLQTPSLLLEPLEKSKKEAQFFFTDESVKAISNILSENHFDRILCIGTPRIHEHIKQNRPRKGAKSFLLDLDSRLCHFFGPDEFSLYNLFNHHFFHDEQKHFDEFLKTDTNVCCIMDPPFGGRIELYKRTLQEISEAFKTINNSNHTLSIILILPYFMEPQIKNHLPFLHMSDYEVTYTNHKSFQSRSPVRIFTNIPLQKVKLPEGYKYCDECQKWTGKWNVHCRECNDCTSKNGTTYVHCFQCEKCVKKSWKHCAKCGRCALEDHKCENIAFSLKCFECNEFGHKKDECPQLKEQPAKRKMNNKKPYKNNRKKLKIK